MLKTILIFLSLLISILLNAQISDSVTVKSRYIKSVKLNFGYKHYTDFDIINNSNSGSVSHPYSYFKNIGIGLLLKSRKTFNTHEVEIGNLTFNKFNYKNQTDSTTQYGNSQNATIRYEFNYFFLVKPSRFSPYVGADILISYSRDKRTSSKLQSNAYTNTARELGLQMSIVPGIQFLLNNRIYFDFSIPLTVYRISRLHYKQYPQFDDHSNEAFSIFNKQYFQARLAIGVYLENVSNKKDFKTEKYTKTIKLNSNGYFVYNHGNNLGFSGLVPLLTFQNKKNFEMHEIELSNLSINRNHFRKANYNHATNLALRYQFNYFFIRREKKLFSPYLGTSYSLSYSKSKSVDKFYPDNNYGGVTLGTDLFIVSGIQFYPGERFYLDFSIPVTILTIDVNIIKKPNPDVGYFYKFFPAFSYKELYFRFGVGYKI
jgi:outer membrane protein W